MTAARARGQTTLDFAIGISVFLAVIVFVFAFVPGILAPFTAADERNTVQVGRVAENLTQGTLGAPNEPYVLDRSQTVDFFERSDGSLADDLHLSPGTNVNVSLTGNRSAATAGVESKPLCWDPGTASLVEADDSECSPPGSGTRLHRGNSPPTTNDATIAAIRVASLAGEGVTVEVIIW